MISSAPTIVAVNNGRKSAAGVTNTLCNHTNKGTVAAATIEPNDTYRVKNTIATNKTPAHNKATGASMANTPTPVATPLPPRNLNHTGKICPTITAIAAAVTIHAACEDGPAKTIAHSTATAPFNASSTSVEIPAPLPARRETFVAPVPPDPVSRTSAPTYFRTIR
jgi:hypothetical protein